MIPTTCICNTMRFPQPSFALFEPEQTSSSAKWGNEESTGPISSPPKIFLHVHVLKSAGFNFCEISFRVHIGEWPLHSQMMELPHCMQNPR
jgi:hypothetical protein